jgi:tripartite-type tricarboxylate transporter receptor subunit TctC
MVASPKVAANDLNSFFDQAREKSGVYTFASSEAMTRMAGERVFDFANVKLLSVPYKGGQWLADLVTGVVDVGFTSLTSALPMAQAGRIKVLAISGTKRSELLPNVKTFREQGVPGLDEGGWVALFAPGRTPGPIVDSIYADVSRVLAKPEVRARIGTYGIEPGGESPTEFSKRFLRDIENYGETARKLNLQPE